MLLREIWRHLTGRGRLLACRRATKWQGRPRLAQQDLLRSRLADQRIRPAHDDLILLTKGLIEVIPEKLLAAPPTLVSDPLRGVTAVRRIAHPARTEVTDGGAGNAKPQPF